MYNIPFSTCIMSCVVHNLHIYFLYLNCGEQTWVVGSKLQAINFVLMATAILAKLL